MHWMVPRILFQIDRATRSSSDRYQRILAPILSAIYIAMGLGCATVHGQVPFQLNMPGINLDHYRITKFASGLGFPVGMTELSDGSILIAETPNSAYFGSSRGALVRLADTNQDGVADEETTLVNQVPYGALTSVRSMGEYVFVTGQGKPITIYRAGSAPTEPLTQIGQIQFNYPSNWLHPNSAVLVRPTGDKTFDVYFQIGSDKNMAVTTRTVGLASSFGLTGQLAGDSVHRVSLTMDGNAITPGDVTHVATGLRNAAGLAWDEISGDLFIAENGIDGLVDANEPTSADELDVVKAQDLGKTVVHFGFPEQYVEYRTGLIVGADQLGVFPVAALQPIPDPFTGSEAEGPNDIAFIPDAFPRPFNRDIVMGMHGRFSAGGLTNEENPLVLINPITGAYSHLVSNNEPGVGHLDGLLATDDSLYIADISPNGAFGAAQKDSGVIYRIQSKFPSIDRLAAAIREGSTDTQFDLDGNQQVNEADKRLLIETINRTYLGDSNLDGVFNSGDFVTVFAAGRYEQADAVAGWRQGDWNGDQRFDSLDLVTVFQEGTYDVPPRAAIGVPEPASIQSFVIASLLGVWRIRSRHRRPR